MSFQRFYKRILSLKARRAHLSDDITRMSKKCKLVEASHLESEIGVCAAALSVLIRFINGFHRCELVERTFLTIPSAHPYNGKSSSMVFTGRNEPF
jgi:hypothetical protein